MDNIILSRRWVQGTPVTIDNLTGTVFTGEAQAHTFRISGVDAAGADVQITGTVTGAFLAPNNTTIPLTGTLTDGVAEVTMTSQCYELPGRFILSVYAANGDTNLCIYCGVGYVFCTETDRVAYPSAAIPDISQLIQEAQDVIDSIPEDYSALSAHFPATGKFVTNSSNTVGANYATAEGNGTKALGLYSHAEGFNTTAKALTGMGAHAEGNSTNANGSYSHAEGSSTTAGGLASHTEGYFTTTSERYAHAEGNYSTASGAASHAEGDHTAANHAYQHVFGTHNVPDDSSESALNKGNYVEIVGNGTSASAQSNARTLDWSGNEELAGDLTVNKGAANEAKVSEIASDVSDLKSAVNFLDDAKTRIDENLYSLTPTTNTFTPNNTYINETGFYNVDTKYKTYMYPVVEGQYLKVVSKLKKQFQTARTTPTSGDSVRVGETYDAGEYYLTVPQGATWLAVSVLKTDDVSNVYYVKQIVSETKDRLLNDEEVLLALEQRKDCIREIDLSSYLFDTNRSTAFARVNPDTMKSYLDGLNNREVYSAARVGLRVLYLPKGCTVITNIDSCYDGSTFPGAFNLGDYRGVILANIVNNGDTVTGTVAFGREKFDGRYREIEIGYTDYYCLFYRTDVNYTNKVYVYYPEKRAILPDGIGVTDITSTVRMQDGYYQYAGNGNWYDNLTEGNGSAGRYWVKSAFLHLTGNSGKSLYIDGMDLQTVRSGVSIQPVIRYTDNGDDTYTPNANSVIYPQYTVAKHNYITVPLTEKDDIRIQIMATASPAFVRFLIVPNKMLFENGLANPVFYGKKILGYGDSYIAGQSASFTWYYVLSQANYASWVNRGHGGAGLCYGANGSLVTSDRITELDEDADIYFLCFGRNDSSLNINIGENDDELDTSVEWDSSYLLHTATFKGAMNYLFNYIETRHPFATIITVTPWGFENNPGVTSGLSCLDYIDAMQEMSKKWGITCFNAAGDAGIHVRISAFRSQYFLEEADQSHLNNNGHLLMAGRAEKLLTNMLYVD